jgi:hypothetical protein
MTKTVRPGARRHGRKGTDQDLQQQEKLAHQQLVLEALAEFPDVKKACEAAGINRSRHYQWLKEDEAYRERYADAIRQGLDALKEVALNLATGAYTRPVVSAGELVCYEQIYSERMLEFLLKSHEPETYKERTAHEVTGKDGGPLEVVFELDLADAGDDQGDEAAAS